MKCYNILIIIIIFLLACSLTVLFVMISQELQDAHQVFKENMPAAQNEFDAIMNISLKIEEKGVHENPYTSLTKEVRISNTAVTTDSML